MKGEVNKVTINDVAKAAGLSKGTVDRVLHNRGEVSRKSREKVMKVIDELGFKPNLHASLLASQKERLICCIVPECLPGEFWSLALKGIEEAASTVARNGVRVECVTFDQYDVESFRSACDSALSSNASGAIVAPIFRDETLRFASALSDAGIPFIYLDSKLDETDYLAYFGMPMYESGYLCADILTGGRHVPHKIYVVRVSRDKKGLSDPTADRRAGFMDYMKMNYPEVEIESVMINPMDLKSVRERLDSTIGAEEGMRFVVMFNSRIHIVADYLADKGIRGSHVVGFDALEKNFEALREGTVQALIAQHTDRQAMNAVNAMADHLLLGQMVAKRDNYTQMDILTALNCNYYL